MVFQDVTERYALESAMRQMQERLQAILASLPDLCLVLDGEGRYLEILGGPATLLARSTEELVGRRVQDVLPPEEAIPILRTIEEALDTGATQRLEYTLETPLGVRYFEGSAAPIRGAEPPAVVWVARDITERKRAEEQLHHLARYDPLTGLANRTLTSARIQQALARNRRRGHYGALMFIDIDRFKHINDSLGHQVGDLLLTRVAEILRSQLRGEDLGADRIAATQRAEAVAEKLRQACAEPIPNCARPVPSPSPWTIRCSRSPSASASSSFRKTGAMWRSCSSAPTSPCTRPKKGDATACASSPPSCRRSPRPASTSSEVCAVPCVRIT